MQQRGQRQQWQERWQLGWEGKQQQQERWQQKANNNQPAMGPTKVGSGWPESVDKVTTRPRRWATTYDESMRRMMMVATKRARVERVMVTAMRVVGDKEGKGNDKKDGIGNEGGMQQRG